MQRDGSNPIVQWLRTSAIVIEREHASAGEPKPIPGPKP